MKQKISVVQFFPIFGEKERNIETITSYIENSDSDIIIFPELATTGYFFQNRSETEKYAEPFGGETTAHFQKIAKERDKIIALGFPEIDGEKLYNSAAILFPDESASRAYRKTHLFYKERFCFDAGDRGFFNIYYAPRDINIGTMICYDWRFPEAARALALNGADLIICPSNLVTDVWHLVMPARALENKVYLAVANRIGRESSGGEELFFNGKSAIYGYNGQPMAIAGPEEEIVLSAEIDPAATRDKKFNEFNDLFSDRRPEMYR
ncbi:MAG: nitrilase-related carbon-nitrogen hydrolase [Candidatus Kapaibacterium sp.]